MTFLLKKLNKKELVYDIQVADTNTFTVGKNLNVVHNCFLNYIEDTAEGLVENLSETNWLSMLGGGVGIGFGIRSADEKSTGVMPHLKIYDASSLAYRQGKTRRGSYAAYLNIDHPDIMNFLEMRKPTGDQNMRTLNMHHGVNIPNKFMEILEQSMKNEDFDDSWELKDPHDGSVREVVSAKYLWQKILELRMMTGEPYLHFIDHSNAALPQWLKDKGLEVHQSNLCVTGDTQIRCFNIIQETVWNGTISDFINNHYKPFEWKVWSYNTEINAAGWKNIENAAMTNPDSEIYEIEDEDSGKIIKCTAEHKIYTKNRGYVMAKDLSETDELVIGCKIWQ